MWIFNLLCVILLVTWNIFLTGNVKALQDMEVTGNVIKFQGEYYGLYGLAGEGKVRHKYPVYSPVYMSETDYELAVGEDYQEALALQNAYRETIKMLEQVEILEGQAEKDKFLALDYLETGGKNND